MPSLPVSFYQSNQAPNVGVGVLGTLLAYAALNPALSLIFYLATGSDSLPQVILATKDLIIFLFIFIFFLSAMVDKELYLPKRLLVPFILIGIFCLWNIVSFAISSADIAAKIINMRRHLILPAILIMTSLIMNTRTVLRSFNRTQIKIGWVIVFLGFIDYFLPDSIWDDVLSIPAYWSTLSLDPWGTRTIAESGRFYSWDLLIIGADKVRRMVSTFLEPTGLASMLGTLVTLTLFSVKRGIFRSLSLVILIVGGILTISKGFFLTLMLCFIFLFHRRLPAIYLPISLILFYGIAAGAHAAGLTVGKFEHLTGLYTGINYVVVDGHLLGRGLGAGGNYAIGAQPEDLDEGAESGFGNLIVQLGLPAFLLPVAVYLILRELSAHYRKNGDPLAKTAFVLLLNWFLIFLYSASSLGLGGNLHAFVIIGLILSCLSNEANSANGTQQQGKLPQISGG